MVSQFSRDALKASGRSSICRPCDQEKARWYYEQNRAERLAKAAARSAAARAKRPPKICKACGVEPVEGRRWYCPTCRAGMKQVRERDRDQLRNLTKTKQSGYGRPHRRVRDRVTHVVEAGGASCARCGLPILPGTPWDLGHDDLDRSQYSGPEHRACNRRTASHAKERREAVAHSRKW